MTGRIIGITHRVKRTAEGEARPTKVAIMEDGRIVKIYDLADETAEMDFVRGCFPVAMRDVTEQDLAADFADHHIKWRKVEAEDAEKFPAGHIKKVGKEFFCAQKVPALYDGLRAGDQVAMILGGSGDYFAFALANAGAKIGAQVYRLPPKKLKEFREANGLEAEQDANNLAMAFQERPADFYEVRLRDLDLILLRVKFKEMVDIMKDRIACGQRIRQNQIGAVFCRPDGGFPDGVFEKAYQERLANDSSYQAFLAAEKEAENQIKKLLQNLGFYEIFASVKGLGPRISARLIANIQDIRRFPKASSLVKFLGVHVMDDGSFPRKKRGVQMDYHPDGRQALFLLGDQFNRQVGSEWNLRLKEQKRRLREKHPEVMCKQCGEAYSAECKKKKHTTLYGDAHIHKMAMWRTLTRFVEHLWSEWTRYEAGLEEPADRGKAA